MKVDISSRVNTKVINMRISDLESRIASQKPRKLQNVFTNTLITDDN
jgi:hypothetical protein